MTLVVERTTENCDRGQIKNIEAIEISQSVSTGKYNMVIFIYTMLVGNLEAPDGSTHNPSIWFSLSL